MDHYKTWQLCWSTYAHYMVWFWSNSVEKLLFWQIFFKNFRCVFSRSNTILAISQEWLVRLMWNNKGSALVAYWIQYVTLTFDLTHDLDLGCFKVKFRNSSIPGIVGLIDVKWKGSELIWYWADCIALPCDHTHDLDLGVSRSESEIALSQELGGRLTMNKMDVSHPFMTMILTCVTMVGWADVPDSDRGDFRHRRVIDISSLFHNVSTELAISSLKSSGAIGHQDQNATIFPLEFKIYHDTCQAGLHNIRNSCSMMWQPFLKNCTFCVWIIGLNHIYSKVDLLRPLWFYEYLILL